MKHYAVCCSAMLTLSIAGFAIIAALVNADPTDSPELVDTRVLPDGSVVTVLRTVNVPEPSNATDVFRAVKYDVVIRIKGRQEELLLLSERTIEDRSKGAESGPSVHLYDVVRTDDRCQLLICANHVLQVVDVIVEGHEVRQKKPNVILRELHSTNMVVDRAVLLPSAGRYVWIVFKNREESLWRVGDESSVRVWFSRSSQTVPSAKGTTRPGTIDRPTFSLKDNLEK